MEIDPNKDFHKLSGLFALLIDLEKQLKQLTELSSRDEYLKVIEELHKFLLQNDIYRIPWQKIKDFVELGNIRLILDSCSRSIEREQLTKDLSSDDLQRFLGEVESLLAEVYSSNLDPRIKKYLIIRLEEICSAMRHYSIGGADALSRVVEASIAGILLREAGIIRNDSLIKRVLDTLLTLGGILDLGANVQGYVLPNVEGIIKFLPSGD